MVHVFAKAGGFADRIVRRWMPDPFVLVLLLSLVALALGFAKTRDAAGLVATWTGGFGNAEILKFGLQIILIVVTGEAIAASPPAKKLLARLTAMPKTATQALLLVTVFAIVTGWLHWGFGLVASALLAREVGRTFAARGVAIHYPLLGTGAYTSMLLWHAGLTASAPLLMNTEKNFVSEVLGVSGPDAKVPLTQTVLAPYNLLACAAIALVVPLLVVSMQPKSGVTGVEGADLPPADGDAGAARPDTPAGRLDHSRVLSFVTGAIGLTFLVRHFRANGFDLNHNVVNCGFLMLGMVLHESPVAYAKAIARSVRGVSGIVLQFPFYGGILEVMKQTGLSHSIAQVFVQAANATTLPLFTFLASILTKSFVPSGAGEWAVEGPPMLQAAKELGVSYGKITMAVAYGNMLGNMYQPFWSLPLLGLMGLRARDIMGFCLVLFVVCLPILALALTIG
ncbi:MAG: short-chain fatty acid transporter [Labilithrix sp.]|nr:short-chain fatty acid transporter [Labilithrix sp.]MCW5815131.1 short-chain fatty acid transporter [Labilithrix sp.]